LVADEQQTVQASEEWPRYACEKAEAMSGLETVKAGIHYMTFGQMFALIYSLDELKDFTKNHVLYDGRRL